ncbi:DUF924 family protein [Roseospirillum parvum]|uniref:Uncharacterized conserved protein, DUF924 family n=1 Tax=Roseospirillum parvum TaxID=83401 RepID=A0A1G7U5L2_9PROT|nr:DUF924 family protein [Roseospirillum parvum]SDG42040.1 Uncharacterized conserved protein, DUF924 family [Roseospirillum parvum]
MSVSPRDILDFWFGPEDGPEFGRPRPIWFTRDADFDAEIAARFADTQRAAAAGQLDSWAGEPESLVALTLLLDQFPRNLYRDDPRAYASDGHILALVKQAIAMGLDRGLPDVHRWFLYLPYEHSEALADQEAALRLFADLPGAEAEGSPYDWAVKHHAVIARFGRFPHRNAVLGRANTAQEEAYLSQPGAGF